MRAWRTSPFFPLQKGLRRSDSHRSKKCTPFSSQKRRCVALRLTAQRDRRAPVPNKREQDSNPTKAGHPTMYTTVEKMKKPWIGIRIKSHCSQKGNSTSHEPIPCTHGTVSFASYACKFPWKRHTSIRKQQTASIPGTLEKETNTNHARIITRTSIAVLLTHFHTPSLSFHGMHQILTQRDCTDTQNKISSSEDKKKTHLLDKIVSTSVDVKSHSFRGLVCNPCLLN